MFFLSRFLPRMLGQQPQNNRGRKGRSPAVKVPGGFLWCRRSGAMLPCCRFPSRKVKDSQPGPFLSIGVSRRCCWDLLSWKGKSQLISWLPVFPLFGRWIRASRMLAGVVPPQDIALELGRGLPCWWGGGGWCPQRDGLISFTAWLGSTNTRLDL